MLPWIPFNTHTCPHNQQHYSESHLVLGPLLSAPPRATCHNQSGKDNREINGIKHELAIDEGTGNKGQPAGTHTQPMALVCSADAGGGGLGDTPLCVGRRQGGTAGYSATMWE